MLTVRSLPDEVHRALRVQAARHGRSTEAEVRELITNAVKQSPGIRVGDALAALGRKAGLTSRDCDVFAAGRDTEAAEPMGFE